MTETPKDNSQSMLGQRIGPYRLVRELGRGGMGVVYLGVRRDDELRMQVAVKLLHKDAPSPRMLERFRRERQLLADLKHPHIAMLLDAGTDGDGMPYFIMEHIQGRTIDHWTADESPSLGTLLRLVRNVARALSYAHGKGVIHRDIKPSNLMVTEEGEPKLLDFGIARSIGPEENRFTKHGELLMTPAYAAPELRGGQSVGESSDVYSLGLVLLQLLTGRPPGGLGGTPLQAISRLTAHGRPKNMGGYFSESITQTTMTHTTDSGMDSYDDTTLDHSDSLSPSNREPVPEALGYVLRRALAAEPDHRYASADDFAKGLDRVLACLPRESDSDTEKVYDALFWYHPDDAEVVTELSDYLATRANLKVWHEARVLGATRSWDGALAQTRVCLVCKGPGAPPWLHDTEMRDNLAFRAADLRILPVLLPQAAFPEQQSSLPAFLRRQTWTRFPDGLNHEAMQRLAETVGAFQREPAPSSLPEGECPYRGLEVFREQDRHLFFGREAITQYITEYLTKHPFIGVLAPSGNGKSSVVQAGVIPELRQRNQVVALFTPRQNPLEELAFILRALFRGTESEQPTEYLLSRLKSSPDSLHFIAREFLEYVGGERLVLVIDQFEEIFTLTRDQSDRDAFIAAVCNAVDQPTQAVSVVLTMRSDFLGRCSVYPDLNSLLLEHAVQVAPMSLEELARAVSEPAKLAGLNLESGLLDKILDDVAGAAGMLPLLEHALMELYERRGNGTLTLAAYAEIGGIEGALAKRAESEYMVLNESERETLRKMFVLCLIHPGEGAEDTRRRATREELLAVGGGGRTVESLLERWTAARLLTGLRDPSRGIELVDVAHEALIRKWDRIREWMDQDRETASLLNRLRQAAHAWLEAGRDEYQLPRGGPLIQMGELVEREANHLSSLEKEFVAAGFALRNKEKQEIEDRRQRELATARKVVTRTRLVALVSILALIAVAFFAFSLREQERHLRKERDAATRVTEILSGIFENTNPDKSLGEVVTAEELLDTGAKKIADELQAQPEIRAHLMNVMGKAYTNLGMYVKARPLLDEAVTISRGIPGMNSLQLAESLDSLAVVLWRMGDYKAAEPLEREALALRQSELGDEHADVGESLNNLALILQQKGDYQVAETLYKQALDVRLKAYGENSFPVSETVNNLATLYNVSGNYDTAEELHRKNIEIRRKLFGEKHPRLAGSVNNLALVLHTKGEFEAAEPLYRQSLEIIRQVMGEEHPTVPTGMMNLAGLLMDMGNYEEAGKLYREALSVRRRILGPNHHYISISLAALAGLHHVLGDYTEAEDLYREALRLQEETGGLIPPDLAVEMSNLACVLADKGQPARGEPLAVEAIARLREKVREDHPWINLAKDALGHCLIRLGRYQEAETILQESYLGIARYKGGRSEAMKRVLRHMILLYTLWEKPDRAVKYQAELDTLTGQSAGE